MTDEPSAPTSRTRLPRKQIEAARTAAIGAAEKTAQAIEGNPMSVVVGGLAIGVLAGSLLPRGNKESDFLRPIGTKLKEGATIALKAARDAGMSELASAGISREAARAQVNKLLDAVSQAATRAGDAAAKTAAKPAKPAKTDAPADPAEPEDK